MSEFSDEEKQQEERERQIEQLATATRDGRESWSRQEAEATARIHQTIDRALSANLSSRLKYNGSSHWGGVKISRNPSISIPVHDVRRLIMMRDILADERAQLIDAGMRLAALLEESETISDAQKVGLILWSKILDQCWEGVR